MILLHLVVRQVDCKPVLINFKVGFKVDLDLVRILHSQMFGEGEKSYVNKILAIPELCIHFLNLNN